jgi:hypothetical protein
MEPENVAFIHKIKLYALFINRNYKTALYRQLFVIQRCPLRQVRLYLQIFRKLCSNSCPFHCSCMKHEKKYPSIRETTPVRSTYVQMVYHIKTSTEQSDVIVHLRVQWLISQLTKILLN